MAIARSIMDGSVSFEGDEWTHVSGSAKNLILGIVTFKFCVSSFFVFLYDFLLLRFLRGISKDRFRNTAASVTPEL